MTILIETLSSIDQKKGKTRARLIEADVKGSSAYYPADVLKSGAHLFKAGTLMFKNHMNAEEQELRPEGDVNNLLGVLESDAVFDKDGLYADLKIFETNKEWLKERAPYIGLSIRASGVVEESDSGPVLKEFQEVFSIDAVTRAGAGGKFVSLAESAKPGVFEESSNPVNEKEENMETDPKLLEALDSQAQEQKALAEAVTALVSSLAPKEPVVEESTVVDALDVADQLAEAGLTKEGRARVLEAHKAGAKLEEAIASEKAYVEQIAESAVEKADKVFNANIEESGKNEVSAADLVFG